MPALLRRRCTCAYYRCNQFVDRATGTIGRELLSRHFRAHQEAESQYQKAQELRLIQSEILNKHETELAERLRSVNSPSEQPAPQPLSTTAREYRTNRDRNILDTISPIQQQCTTLTQRFHNLPALTDDTSLARILIREQELQSIRLTAMPLITDIQVIAKALRGRSQSVKEMHSRTNSDLKQLATDITRSLGACRALAEQRKINAQNEKSERRGFFDTEHHFRPVLPNAEPLVQLVVFMVVVCSIILRLSHRGCAWLFAMTHHIIQTVARIDPNNYIPSRLRHVLDHFPRDPITAIQQFDVGTASSTIFATCPNPRCRATHRPVIDSATSIPLYPNRCTAKLLGRGGKRRCGFLLVTNKEIGGRQIPRPIIPFISLDMKDWVASLLARKGVEAQMDRAWVDAKSRPDTDTCLRDIFHGTVVHDLKAPDGAPFSESKDGEGRYVFSLSVDWFNPLTNKQAGKKVSVGVISLICLNLPPEERYRAQNMFIAGLIPGPSEPKLDTANHFLTPLVDDLEKFWDPGYFFSRTAQCPDGRRVRCAVVALVCDLPAARKIAGFASYSALRFCSRCKCQNPKNITPRKEKSDSQEATDAASRPTRKRKLGQMSMSSAPSPPTTPLESSSTSRDSTPIPSISTSRDSTPTSSTFASQSSSSSSFNPSFQVPVASTSRDSTPSLYTSSSEVTSISRDSTPSLSTSSSQASQTIPVASRRRQRRAQKEIARSQLPPERLQPDINNYNISEWELRTNEECRAQSERYCSAVKRGQAQSWFDLTGKRWSELERLPYFDITRFVVVDPMHNLFLGLLKVHFRDILGFKPSNKSQRQRSETYKAPPVVEIDIKATNDNPFPTEQTAISHVRDLIKWLQQPMSDALEDNATVDLWEKRFYRWNLTALCYVSVGLGLLTSEVATKIKRKSEFVIALKTWRAGLVEAELEEPEYDIVYTSDELGHAFTATEIEDILATIESVVQPSWLTRAPVLSHGKLKADDWRSLATTSFPVALVRLWSHLADQKHVELLEMSLVLVSAIIVATSRVTSQQHADEYMRLMTRYRELMHRRFPDYQALPNHHMAMHIGEFLPMYGPVHSWWTYPFERVIGSLQRISTNYIPGQYEATLLDSSSRSTNLMNLFTRTSCPDALTECRSIFDKLVAQQSHDTHVVDALMDPSTENPSHQRRLQPLASDLSEAFAEIPYLKPHVTSRVHYLTHLTQHGIRYSIRSRHVGNSAVLLLDATGKQRPARIEYIFRLPTLQDQIFVAVRQYQELDAESMRNDPFQKYPQLRAEMWSTELYKELSIVQANMLDDQYACWVMPWKLATSNRATNVLVVMSLSRDVYLQT